MRTNIVLDDDIIKEAFSLQPDIKTKKDLVDTALKEFISSRKMKNLRKLRGTNPLASDYDYKALRIGK